MPSTKWEWGLRKVVGPANILEYITVTSLGIHLAFAEYPYWVVDG